jgi:CheY-like chemotaxis protein
VKLLPLTVSGRIDGRPRVLVVDDDLAQRYALAELLRSDGCDVQTSSGHESWLALFKICLSEPAAWVSFVAAVDPDLVMLDIEQPSALATLGAVRRHPLTEHVPVVVIGDSTHDRSLQAALLMGAIRLVHRPLTLAGLRPLIDDVLAEAPPRNARTGDERPSLVVH